MNPRHHQAMKTRATLHTTNRRHSVARRLLTGAGKAEVAVFDLDPHTATPMLAHGVSTCGGILVAAHEDAVPLTDEPNTPLRMRVDFTKGAPEWRADIIASTLHALGTITWVAPELVDGCLHSRHFSDSFAAIAALPGVRVGTLELTDMHTHDCSGVASLHLSDVFQGTWPQAAANGRSNDAHTIFPQADDEICARDALESVWGSDLTELFSHPQAIAVPFRHFLSPEHLRGEVFCVDIDSTGIILMRLEEGGATLVELPFAEPVSAPHEFERVARALKKTQPRR